MVLTMLKACWFFALLFVALSMGMALAHALELIPKMEYDASVYLHLHRTLYRFFGPPLGALVEVIAVLLSVVLAILARNHAKASFGAVLAAVCMIVTQAIWWIWVYPANVAMVEMSLEMPQGSWIAWRDQWEYTHLARFFLQLVALCALLASVLRETHQNVGKGTVTRSSSLER